MRAILFDFDGVLTVDKYGSDSILRYLSENTPVPMDTLKREYYKINRGLLYGEYTHKDIWTDYCKNVGCDIDYQILIDSFINTPLDWDSTKTYQDRYNVFKNGISTWQDGDIILCHETKGETYTILEELLPDFYRAGYRFCSIAELMELRGISLDQISGELNNVDGNNGMVVNVVKASKYGKKGE